LVCVPLRLFVLFIVAEDGVSAIPARNPPHPSLISRDFHHIESWAKKAGGFFASNYHAASCSRFVGAISAGGGLRSLRVKTVGIIALIAVTGAIFGATPFFLIMFAFAPGHFLGIVPAAAIILVWVFLIRYLRRQKGPAA
jgi:hypothetical protein